jgi:hypothetical protein
MMRCAPIFVGSALKTRSEGNELIVSPQASRYKASDFV